MYFNTLSLGFVAIISMATSIHAISVADASGNGPALGLTGAVYGSSILTNLVPDKRSSRFSRRKVVLQRRDGDTSPPNDMAGADAGDPSPTNEAPATEKPADAVPT